MVAAGSFPLCSQYPKQSRCWICAGLSSSPAAATVSPAAVASRRLSGRKQFLGLQGGNERQPPAGTAAVTRGSTNFHEPREAERVGVGWGWERSSGARASSAEERPMPSNALLGKGAHQQRRRLHPPPLLGVGGTQQGTAWQSWRERGFGRWVGRNWVRAVLLTAEADMQCLGGKQIL